MSQDRPAIRYHGAKWRLARWVMAHFPPHRTYVEPFGGGAGVLLRKPRSYAEVYNDLDGEIVNFFRVLRDPDSRARLIEACVLTPYARAEFLGAWGDAECPVERARRTAIRAQMGFGSAGATKRSTGFRCDTQRSYSTGQHDWATYPDAIARCGERFAGVLIENRPALELLAQHDEADTLFYVDPPYLRETRGGRQDAYRHEMSNVDHATLLDRLNGLRGAVVLSGYPSALYERYLTGWRRVEREARISSQRGSVRRLECLWIKGAAHG